MLGFKRFKTAAVTIGGIELAAKIKKDQFNLQTANRKASNRSGNLGTRYWRHKAGKALAR